MIFLGHIHHYDKLRIEGTRYIISACGRARLYDKYGFGKPRFGFVLIQSI